MESSFSWIKKFRWAPNFEKLNQRNVKFERIYALSRLGEHNEGETLQQHYLALRVIRVTPRRVHNREFGPKLRLYIITLCVWRADELWIKGFNVLCFASDLLVFFADDKVSNLLTFVCLQAIIILHEISFSISCFKNCLTIITVWFLGNFSKVLIKSEFYFKKSYASITDYGDYET